MMKRLGILTFLVCCTLSLFGIEWTQPFTGITWRFDKVGTDSAIITGYYDLAGEVEIPQKVAGYTVVEIAPRVFRGCDATKITIGSTVRCVGASAFAECEKLRRISFLGKDTTIGEGLCADCKFLEYVTLPSNLVELTESSFSGCYNLRSISLPNTITTIGDNALLNCRSLTALHFPTSAVNLGVGVCAGCTNITHVTLSPKLINIPNETFYNCKSLAGIDIPSSVTNIGTKAFSECWSIQRVSVPGSVVTMGTGIFEGCKGLQQAILEDGVTQVASSMFQNCGALSSLNLPETLVYIGPSAIWGCDRLRNLTIPKSVKTINSSGLLNNLNDAEKRIVFKCSPPLVIGSSLALNSYVAIGIPAEFYSLWYAFLPSCNGGFSSYNPLFHFYVTWDYTYTVNGDEAAITGTTFNDRNVLLQYGPSTLTIPSTLGGYTCTRIADNAFRNYTKIEAVYFYGGSPLCEIGDSAFAGCEMLSSLSIPPSVVRVGKNAFSGTRLIDGAECIIGDWLVEMSDASLVAYAVPSGVRHIADGAFVKAQNLEDVVIGDEVTSIGADAFKGIPVSEPGADGIVCADKWAIGYKGDCPISLEFTDNIHAIADSSFTGLGVTNVTINESVKIVGRRAFANCASLKRVVCDPAVTIINTSAFEGCPCDMEIGPILHRVRFDANGVPCEVDDITVKNNNPIGELPVLNGDAQNLDFLGWYLEKDDGVKVDSGYLVVAETTLYAHWQKKRHIVSIDPNFTGSTAETKIYEHGSQLGILDPLTRTGYRFIGWFSDPNSGSIVSPESVVISNITIYAHWMGECRVIYNSNNGVGEMADQVIDVGVAFSLNTNAFAREGFVFAGWSLVPNGDVTYADGQIMEKFESSIIRLYAVWAVDSEFTCVEMDDGSLEIAGLKTAHTGGVLIPNSIAGHSVSRIGSGAFRNHAGITSVIIADGIKCISSDAFSSCPDLSSVVIPKSLERIGQCAFYNCTGLKAIRFNGGPMTVEKSAFYGCTNLTGVGISNILDWLSISFENEYSNPLCYNAAFNIDGEPVSGLVIPTGITMIGKHAFQGGCFTSLMLPVGITNVGKSAFEGCKSLKRVDTPSIVDWLMLRFDNAGANPLSNGAALYVNGEEIADLEIPSGTSELGDWSFCGGCFTTVEITDSITNIAETAFAGCTNVLRVKTSTEINVYSALCRSIGTNAAWTEDGRMAGQRIFRSNPIGNRQSTTMELRIPVGMERLVFSWKVSSENGYDWLSWSLDGKQINRISGDRNWSTVTYELDGAAHTLSFTYAKDAMTVGGSDCGWVAFEDVVPFSMKKVFPGSYEHLVCVDLTSESKTLHSGVFDGCGAIRQFSMPSDMTNIEQDVFLDCVELSRVDIPDIAEWLLIRFENAESNPLCHGASLYVNGELMHDLVIPAGTTKIGSHAFQGGSFASVTIPSGVSNVADFAFADCKCLSRVEVASIAEWIAICFDNATANPLYYGAALYVDGEEVKSLVVPQGTKKIGAYAFSGGAITSVTLTKGIESVGIDAFSGCESIVGVYVPTLADWLSIRCENMAANPLHTGAMLYVDGEIAKELVVPDGVGEIGPYALANGGFTSVRIPGSVTNLSETAFLGCSKISQVSVGSIQEAKVETEKWTQVAPCIYRSDKLTSLNQTATMTLDVYGPQTLSFSWKKTNVSGNSFCCYLDGVVCESIPYQYSLNVYREVSIDVPSGLHQIKWTYSTNSSIGGSGYSDPNYIPCCGWVILSDALKNNSGLHRMFPDSYDKIRVVKVAADVSALGDFAFADCASLENIIFMGDAPVVGVGAFTNVLKSCRATVNPMTAGWDDDGDGCWQGLKLVYAGGDAIPNLGDSPSAADVMEAIANAADKQITRKIDEVNYNDFRDWAGKVKTKDGNDVGAQGVMDAQNAWLSYALGQDSLLETAPTDDDVSVESFEPTAEAGKFDFTVSIKNIEIGIDALKENLKKVFELEGAATLEDAAFSSDKVDVEFGTPVDGKVKFTAGPNAKNADEKTFFMKVKMTP